MSSGSDGPATTIDPEILGSPDEADGEPITIGVVTDGRTDAIDNTQVATGAQAAVDYANDYLGGINGHVVEIETCETGQTPSGATTCAVEMIDKDVDAVLVGVLGQDAAVFNGLAGSGIPYFIYATAAQDILLKPGAFALSNPIAGFGAGVRLATENDVDRVAMAVIDVPAASGPVAQIATPLFEDAGITLDLVNVSPQVADMTPQIQEALSQGAEQFELIGTEQFIASGLKALRQAQFDGNVVSIVSDISEEIAATVPGGFEGVLAYSATTSDPDDPDVQLQNAVMAEYASDEDNASLAAIGYITVMAFIAALTGATDAVDAASITAALSAMPEPIPLPMGGGITFQCGTPPAPFLPNVCVTNILQTALGEDGQPTDFEFIDVSEFMQFG
ncbi:MAG TPA: ABC transporter substrate-binding protein [Microthrixaceae bacterium]|nr:ABC transporter substrate-binding protein [Microthrixaceae bacterium]